MQLQRGWAAVARATTSKLLCQGMMKFKHKGFGQRFSVLQLLMYEANIKTETTTSLVVAIFFRTLTGDGSKVATHVPNGLQIH